MGRLGWWRDTCPEEIVRVLDNIDKLAGEENQCFRTDCLFFVSEICTVVFLSMFS